MSHAARTITRRGAEHLYGGALMLSLGWMLWKSELSWSPWIVMLPVVLGLIGDWIQNVIPLDQLQRYINAGNARSTSNSLQSRPRTFF